MRAIPQKCHHKMSYSGQTHHSNNDIGLQDNAIVSQAVKWAAVSIFFIDVVIMSALAVIIPPCLWILDWPYSIIFAPLFIYHGAFYLALVLIIVCIITVILPILITITILLLIMAVFTLIFGHDYQYFIDAIFATFQALKTPIVIIFSYLFEFFVWTRYKILFLDILFVVGQMASAIILIVVFTKYQLKGGDIFEDRYNINNQLINLLLDHSVLIYYLIIPYIVFAFIIFISRTVLNRIYGMQSNTMTSSKPKPLVFLTLFKSLNKMQESNEKNQQMCTAGANDTKIQMITQQQNGQTQDVIEQEDNDDEKESEAEPEPEPEPEAAEETTTLQDIESDLPPGWKYTYNENDIPYYYNEEDKDEYGRPKTQWEKPQ
eukprot:311020_1